MSILSRYILRLHLVPFIFALSAMTGIMLVNQIARRLRDLVGKGLPWHVIAEVFGLSIPFILAMTLPMAVLVAVLYTMGRLTVDNELTAMRASGVSLGAVVRPLLIAGTMVAAGAFLFSDQILPRSNHRLRTLLTDINRTKPTFGMEEQIVNEVQRGQVFLRAGSVDDATHTLRDVTIVDISDHNRKRVTYADSAYLAFAPNEEDLILTLFHGAMHETDRVEAENFQVADFQQDRVRVKNVAGNFSRTENDTYRGDREMGVCEMDSIIVKAKIEESVSRKRAASVEMNSLRAALGLAILPHDTLPPEIRRPLYCRALDTFLEVTQPEELAAQELEDSDSTAVQASQAPSTGGDRLREAATGFRDPTGAPPRVATARVMHERANNAKVRAAQYLVELHKKYAIAAACIVFVLVGVPAAIKFPRGGVGLVVGMSLVIFTVYYVGLIAGESLANKLVVTPFWAMWTPNILFAVIGVIALWRIRKEATAGRGAGGIWPFRRKPPRRGNPAHGAPADTTTVPHTA